MLLQNNSFATFGYDDMEADSETIRQYAGKSSLRLIDSLTVHFLHRSMLLCEMKTPDSGNRLKHQNDCSAVLLADCCVS